MKIATSINSGEDLNVHSQCIMPICALLFGQTEGILKNTAFLPSLRSITGWHFSAKVSTKVLRKN